MVRVFSGPTDPIGTAPKVTGDGLMVRGPLPVPATVAESVVLSAPVAVIVPVLAPFDFGVNVRTIWQ
jgi:hypothetical protein